MTGFTKVSGSPTEPLGYRTTKSTLKLNELCPMLLTIRHSPLYVHRCTFSTHQLFRLIILSLLLSLFTILHASKIRVLTLKTLVIGELVNRKGFQIIIELISWIFQSRVLVQSFIFGSLFSFSQHFSFNLFCLSHFICENFAVSCSNALFA